MDACSRLALPDLLEAGQHEASGKQFMKKTILLVVLMLLSGVASADDGVPVKDTRQFAPYTSMEYSGNQVVIQQPGQYRSQVHGHVAVSGELVLRKGRDCVRVSFERLPGLSDKSRGVIGVQAQRSPRFRCDAHGNAIRSENGRNRSE